MWEVGKVRTSLYAYSILSSAHHSPSAIIFLLRTFAHRSAHRSHPTRQLHLAASVIAPYAPTIITARATRRTGGGCLLAAVSFVDFATKAMARSYSSIGC